MKTANKLLEVLNDAVCRAEAARIAGVSAQCVSMWIKRGRIKRKKRFCLKAFRWEDGDMIIIMRTDLEAWLERFPPMLQKRNKRRGV